ncbi:MAG TPA: hypothetical protein VM925_23305, partial [Labilithrix sp.]|nr:hypothetical protein [Labilithrix sp.]
MGIRVGHDPAGAERLADLTTGDLQAIKGSEPTRSDGEPIGARRRRHALEPHDPVLRANHGTALLVEDLGVLAFYVALAIGPWAALGLSVVLGRLLRHEARGLLGSVAAFVDAAEHTKGDVVVWDASVEARSMTIAERIANRLGTRGAVIRTKNRIMWFESMPASSRTDWLAV